MRTFKLIRDTDPTGVSGTGVVAEGVEFSNGVVAVRWLSEFPTSVVFHDRGLESVNAVHGHGGATRVVWDDQPLDAAYDERNRAVAALTHACRLLGLPVGTTGDPAEPDWPVVMIQLPTGQVSWHVPARFAEDHLPRVGPFPHRWDGHTSDEKYDRLARWTKGEQ